MGSTPAPRPRRAQQWLDRAALGGGQRQSPNRPIARRIRRRRERPELRRVRLFRWRRIGVSAAAESPPPSAVQEHAAAQGRAKWPTGHHRRAAAARRRLGRPGQRRVTLRCAAQPNRNRNSRARAGTRRSKPQNGIGSSRSTRRGRAGCTPPPHSPRPLRAPSLPALLVPTDVPSMPAVGARRSSGQGGDHPRSTRTVTVARAARLVVHYCTRGSKCRARRARAAASIGSAKCARARSALPRTARGGRRVVHANARATRRSASSPFRPLSRRIGFGVTGRAATPGEGRGASARRARRSAQSSQCLHQNMSVLGQVLTVWTRALAVFRSNPISANAPQRLGIVSLCVCVGGGGGGGGRFPGAVVAC